MAVVDIFRLEGGKIVEYWDVVQEIPETSTNSNPMSKRRRHLRTRWSMRGHIAA